MRAFSYRCLKTLVHDSVWLYHDKFEFLLQDLPALEELELISIGWKDCHVVEVIV